MGVFSRRVAAADITRSVAEEIDAIVDTDADYCLVPANLAEKLNLPSIGEQDVELGDGRIVYMPMVAVRLEMQGRIRIVAAFVGEPGATPVIGAKALAEFGFGVDPEGERLIPQVARLLATTGWPTW